MHTKIWQDIEKKNFAPIYVLYGKEEFIVEQTKRKLIENAIEPSEMDFNFAVIDLETTPIEYAIDELSQFPFIGDKRVVILDNAYLLTAVNRKEKVEHNTARLLAYMNNPFESTIAVFIAPTEKLDERKKIVKELNKTAQVLNAKEFDDRATTKWILDLAKENNVRISSTVASQIAYKTGNSLVLIHNEFDKLVLHIDKGGEITSELVETLVTRSLEENIFRITDLVIKRQKREAIDMYRDLLTQKEEPIAILALIARQFRILAQVKFLSGEGLGAQGIASRLKLNPFVVKLAMQQIHHFDASYLTNALDQLAEIDYQMKTGYGERELLLELFILKN